MSITLDTYKNISPDIAFFRFKKTNQNDYLITNDIGKYAFLTLEEFDLFVIGKLEGEKKLELLGKYFYKTPDYEDAMVTLYNQKHSFLAFGPTLHMIVMTLRCNHKCRYCHAAVAPMTAKHFDMTLETAQKVVDTIFFSSSPGVTIEFQGGEPLVNWEVFQYIVEYAQAKAQALQKHLTFSLVSNMSLMDEEKLTWILDHAIDISTSLDGEEDIHNSQRIWAEGNSYEKVIYWIARIREERLRRGYSESAATIGALATWTKTSIKKYKENIDTYKNLGLTTIGFRWFNPYGFALAEREEMEFSLEEFKIFFKDGLEYLLQINKSGYKLREMISTVYLAKILLNQDGGFMDIRSPSGIAIGAVAYNYDGKVYAGDESRMLGRMGIEDFLMTPMLDTGENTYKAMANSQITKIAVNATTTDGIPGYNEHVYKPYLGVDMIYNFMEYGTIYSQFSKDEKNQMQVFILDILFEKLRDGENEKVFRSWFE